MVNSDESILNAIFGEDTQIGGSKKEGSCIAHSFDFISNPDGSIRWIWPSETTRPLFLKFYSATTKRALFIAKCLKILFYLPVIKRIYIKKLYVHSSSELFVKQQLEEEGAEYAIFTGTVGPNRKVVVYQEHNSNSSFLKIPYGDNASKALLNELDQSVIFDRWTDRINTPKLTMKNGVLKSTDLKIGNERQVDLSIETQMTLVKLIDDTVKKESVGTYSRHFFESENENEQLEKLRILILKFIDTQEDKGLLLSINHGDFTPWNCYQEGGILKMYDLEFSSEVLPIYYDVFHFWSQQLVMCSNKSNNEILELIRQKWDESAFALHAVNFDLTYQQVMLTYLYFVGTHYYKVYSNQPEIHSQGMRLIDFMIDAMNVQFNEVQGDLRAYHIDRVSEQLTSVDHCILKEFEGIELIKNTNSDIDVIMNSRDVEAFVSNLSSRGVAKKVLHKKSFMQTVELYFVDGTFLSIDVISQLKQRWHHYLEIGPMLKTAEQKSGGLYYASDKVNVEYIFLFYLLNGAKIPSKYVKIIQELPVKVLGRIRDYISEKYDLDLIEILKDEKPLDLSRINKLKSCSDHIPANKGIGNYFNYIKDSFTGLNFNYSKVITFSGVDGAGKTTVINETKEILEERYRQKVVVIRHRPSVLPILSAYIYGKEKASQKSMETLPRQGNNKSTITSILRFGYYLLDYVFGQFYVFLRYTMLNYIVIYDRYYFDFILDSKRSNITLDQKFPKAFFGLIMKPTLNFFLYAQPEVILKRKKELTESDIITLNSGYKQLFSELACKHKANFISIENIELDKTMGLISQNYVLKM